MDTDLLLIVRKRIRAAGRLALCGLALTVSLFLSSCRSLDSGSTSAASRVFAPAGTSFLESGERPAFSGVRLSPRGDRVAVAVEFEAGESRRLTDGADAGIAIVRFDIDQNAGTGAEGGEECSFHVRDGRVESRRWHEGAWQLVETTPAGMSPRRISFEIPSELLGDDIHVDWTVELFDVINGEWIPAAVHTGSNHPVPTAISRVPVITNLHSEVRQGTLYIRAQLTPRRESRSRYFYEPEVPGGWALQVFVNTDEEPTGYWLGYDYIVRGVEWTPGRNGFVVRRIDPAAASPGGWGPGSGVSSFREQPRAIEIRVPLSALGDDDGRLNYAVETYATVACEECESGHSHVFAGNYFGASDHGGRDRLMAIGPARIPDSNALRPRDRSPGNDASPWLLSRRMASR